MEKELIYREIKRFRTPDGRIIEQLKVAGKVTTEVDDECPDDNLPENFYVGVFPIFNPQFGMVEQRFSLDDPETLEEAFIRYAPKAMEIKAELKRREEAAAAEGAKVKAETKKETKKETQPEEKIVTAPAEALNQTGEPSNEIAK